MSILRLFWLQRHTIKMVFNTQHALVDFHLLGHVEGHHQVIKGMIDQQMPVAQERVVIKTMSGQTVAYPVRPRARGKMASMPVGVDAVFLADGTGKIVDVPEHPLVSREYNVSLGKLPQPMSLHIPVHQRQAP